MGLHGIAQTAPVRVRTRSEVGVNGVQELASIHGLLGAVVAGEPFGPDAAAAPRLLGG